MKRKITSKLYEWKNMIKGRMPLLIYGARQVGKHLRWVSLEHCITRIPSM